MLWELFWFQRVKEDIMTGWFTTHPEPMDLRTLAPQIDLPQLREFMPIAVLCAISILGSLLWLLVEWQYTSGRNRQISDEFNGRHRQGHS